MKVLLAVHSGNDVTSIVQYLRKRFAGTEFDLDVLTVLQAGSNVLGQLGRLSPDTDAEMRSYNAACDMVSNYARQIGQQCQVGKMRTHVEYGEPAEVILGFSRRSNTSLLLLGAPVRSGMLTAFRIDGITRRLLKWADCPVEVCKPLVDDATEFRVLVPLALTAGKNNTHPDISAYRWPGKCHVHLLGIVQPGIDETCFEANGAAVLLKMMESHDAQAKAKAQLQKHSQELALRLPPEAKTSHEIIEGDPRDVTAVAARELSPDLVVLTQGWEGDSVPNPFSSLAPVSLMLSAPCSVMRVDDRTPQVDDLMTIGQSASLSHSR
ncbi:MAG: universal stress protein [Pseudohongiellaceae bacterium]